MGLLEPHGRHRRRDGEAALTEAPGRLLGIARKDRPRGAVLAVDEVAVGLDTGIEGDFRGVIRPGRSNRRQVTIMALADWRAALRDLGAELPWTARRANLLVDGIELPRTAGTRLQIGSVLLEVTGECDPCSRMEEVAAGLRAALTPDWRGGRLLRVLAPGHLRTGERVSIVEP